MTYCRILNKYFNILFALLFAVVVSSCAKEELEGPSEVTGPQPMLIDRSEPDHLESLETDDAKLAKPVYINDDGDEEDEGLKPTIPDEIKK